MGVVRYIAKRSLTLSVTIGEQVTFDLPMRYAGIQRSRQAQVNQRESMAGKIEAYYYRGRRSWTINLIPVGDTLADRVRQFLDSVEDKQIFQFAPYATSTTPSPEWLSVFIDPAQYTESLHESQQDLTVFGAFTLVEEG